MKRKRYSEEKIISILKEHEEGVSMPELSRRYGIVENTVIGLEFRTSSSDCKPENAQQLGHLPLSQKQ